VGLVEEFNISENVIPLASGDVMVLYTDGVTEAFNSQGEFFGPQRLARIIQQGFRLPAQELVRTVRDGLLQFTQRQALDDDTTIVAVARI
jgi:serine phosphatase RsbU (regulator of sigma subunit)